MGYNVLERRDNICPEGCSLCEDACSKRNDGVSAIRHLHVPTVKYHGLIACGQCGQPECMEICPTGAIAKNLSDGVVRITEERCVGCGMCTLACPYGGVTYRKAEKKSEKCDFCDGDPECVKACPYGALQVYKSQEVKRYMGDEDLLSPGTRACPGCAAELSYRTALRHLEKYKDVALFGCPGCMTIMMTGSGTMPGSRTTYVACLFTNVFSTMTGVSRYYRRKGRDVNLVAFVGDGHVADIGFQSLSGAAERGERIVVICYDNEGYQNTGNQKSSTTPRGTRTYTSPVGGTRSGKAQENKDVPLIMVAHKIPYVATATIAYQEDFLKKLEKAMSVKSGMAYIHLLAPCPTGWGFPTERSVELSRMAVETDYFPLWEYENGKLRFTYKPPVRKPVGEYIRTQGKFSHFTEKDLEEVQESVRRRFDYLSALSEIQR